MKNVKVKTLEEIRQEKKKKKKNATADHGGGETARDRKVIVIDSILSIVCTYVYSNVEMHTVFIILGRCTMLCCYLRE